MVESNQENKKIRGFAVLINSILLPLNENRKFKEKFGKFNVKILLNASNLNYAAIIMVDKGLVRVESIPNKPKENLKKRKIGWNSYLEMDSQTFLAIAMNRLSLVGVAKKWLTREIKMRGIRKLIILLKIFRFLTNYEE
ncbi:MAG: hypothetical protein KGD58_00890 [Candidatus Lokiarchaeota archaeon]|nr:hypothetical protein [Candidatus Lokiarchaeota archaeon]